MRRQRLGSSRPPRTSRATRARARARAGVYPHLPRTSIAGEGRTREDVTPARFDVGVFSATRLRRHLMVTDRRPSVRCVPGGALPETICPVSPIHPAVDATPEVGGRGDTDRPPLIHDDRMLISRGQDGNGHDLFRHAGAVMVRTVAADQAAIVPSPQSSRCSRVWPALLAPATAEWNRTSAISPAIGPVGAPGARLVSGGETGSSPLQDARSNRIGRRATN